MRLAPLLFLPVLLASLAGFNIAAHAQDEEPAEEPGWTGKISLGASLSAGTSDSFGGNFSMGAEREWGATLLRLSLDAKYGKTSKKHTPSVTDTDEQTVTQYLRRSLSDRLYIYTEAEEGRDSVRNIEQRLLLTAGPGYKVWDGTDGPLLDVESGIGYRYENFGGLLDPLPADGKVVREKSRNDVTGRVAFLYKNKIGVADFGQSGEFLLPFNDTGAWLARAESKLSFPVLSSWSFVNTLGTEYDNNPSEGSDKFELDYVVSLEHAF